MSEEYIEEGINGQWTDWKFEAENYKKICEQLQQENKQLKENNMSMQEEMARTWKKADLYKEVIEEVREYIKECSSREISLDILEILDKVKVG